MHSHSLFQRWLFILSSLIFGGALSAGGLGCALDAEPPAGDELRRQFPDQAPQVLETSEAFVAVDGGFARASAGDLSRGIDIETLLPRGRGALEATMPALGEEAIRLRLPDGFEARVREVGAEGEGAVVERAVAYPRKGGTSFWAALDDGYEEWLMLDAGVARADAPAAAWEVEGATLRQQGDAVEVVDDAGTARLRVTAPAAFALGGRPIAARLTARGATLELWADAGGEPALVDPLWTPAGTMSAARHSHTATPLQNGKVLVAGGANSAIVASAELYDPATNSWSAAGSLATGRRNHAATTLSTGKVLVMGGRSFSGATIYASAELYDPATNTWSPAAPMSVNRYGHTATLLLNGRVLVTGGRNSTYPTNAALYQWQTNSWSSAGDMGAGRYNHTATRLLDGRVLVTGGYNIVSLELSSAEIFNPSTLTWTAAHSMNVRRNLHAAALLPNGQVLVTGGTVSNSLLVSTANVELYSPSINTWTECQTMIDQRTLHTATVLASGKVLLTGGRQYSGSTAVDLASAEVFDRAATPWVLTPPMAHAHRGFFATRFYDGRVLAAGGDIGSGSKAADVYDPNTNTWTSVAPTAEVHEWATITGFVNNKVLVAGGTASTTANNAELYDPSTNTWSSVGTGSLARENHTATLLYNGKALIAGGSSTSINNTVLANTRLFDPAGNSWTATASMGIARYGHTATLLANGKVLVTGGSSTGGYQATAEIYDPATNTWSPVPSMGQPRCYHTATLMGDGNVLVVGGDNDDEYSLVSTEIYRPSSNDWVYGANISVGRSSHTATALNDGRVLVAGGWTFNPLPPNGLFKQASASIYDPVSNTWTAVGPMRDHRVFHSAVLLGDGSVLIASGLGPSALPGTAVALTTAEILTP